MGGLVCAVAVSCSFTAAAEAQRPSAATLGLSFLTFDAGGDQTYAGVTGGIRSDLSGTWRLGAAASYWPNLYDFGPSGGGWSAQLESEFRPVGVRRGGPFFHYGLGYFRSAGGTAGIASFVGVGWHLNPMKRVALRPQALLRSDAGLQDFELRFLVEYGISEPRVVPDRSDSDRVKLWPTVRAVVGLGKGYDGVEPVYGLQVERRGAGRIRSVVGVDLLHLRSAPRRVPITWDTRAVMFTAGGRVSLLAGGVGLDLTVALAPVLLPEGPDQGSNPGVTLGVRVGTPLKGRWLLAGMADFASIWWRRSGNQGLALLGVSLGYPS